MKAFNTTGVCVPEKHYMVNIQNSLDKIGSMVDTGEYLCINRARQYGKTTTLALLKRELDRNYRVVSLDFQDMSSADYKTEGTFVQAFCQLVLNKRVTGLSIPETIEARLADFSRRTRDRAGLRELFMLITEWCVVSERGIVLIIDEVDSATGNQVFLDFLSQLRSGYIKRDTEGQPALKSVILAGVTDVKHLRSRIRDDDQHKVNSPWNIAVDPDLDMSLPAEGIEGMLREYAADHGIDMNANQLAASIREYTNGYPFLVSRLCQLIDGVVAGKTGINTAWSRAGLEEAIKMLLNERNTLFESMTGKLVNYPEMKKALHSILMDGARIPYNPMQEGIAQMEMYGFIINNEGSVAVSNRIFETLLYNLFLSDDELGDNAFGREGDLGKSIFVRDGILNMPLILEHFIRSYTEICGPLEDRFKEKDGRELFLLYLKPIINGTGNYYIEAQTRDQRRMDVIVDYLGRQYIIELKIWHGERYNTEGERQISDYLDYFGLNTGYMLSFNFNRKKEPGVKRIEINDKVLFEGML